MPSSPRRYLTAYALWLFWPFYPFYALYLGRDTHAWLYSVTFGGLGLGWLVDGLCMPLYVADHNDSEGYLQRAESRHNAWVTWTTWLFPARWLVLAVSAGAFALLGANLVPADAVLEPLVGELFAQATGSKLSFSGASGSKLANGRLWINGLRLVGATCGAAVGLRLATPCVFTVRRKCCFRHMFGWGIGLVALVVGTDDFLERVDREGFAHLAIIAGLGTWLGALRGRRFDPYLAPKTTTRHSFTLRLMRHGTVVGIFWLLCGGAFYMNGSFTWTDRETGKTTTYTGPEALHRVYVNTLELKGETSKVVEQLRAQYGNKTWTEILAEVREAFADPAVEASEVLGVSSSATAAEVRKAHRDLARQHHPDKVGNSPELQAQAEQKMQKLNWAKEVLLKGVD